MADLLRSRRVRVGESIESTLAEIGLIAVVLNLVVLVQSSSETVEASVHAVLEGVEALINSING